MEKCLGLNWYAWYVNIGQPVHSQADKHISVYHLDITNFTST